jgi:hypothetical protein
MRQEPGIFSMDSKWIGALSCLLRQGFLSDRERRFQAILQGIAFPTSDGWAASRLLLAQREALGSDNELVMALLALQPEWRAPWLRILAARCREAGQMGGEALADLVTQVGGAAAWVEARLPHASLEPTPSAAVERELLGVSAEQAAATPMLARVLAVAFELSVSRNDTLPILPMIDGSGVQADQNWIKGRLLALPGTTVESNYLLHGKLAASDDTGTDDTAMTWVLRTPWALLLTMIVYAQYNWAAETRGGLLLELTPGQNAFTPGEISVLVAGPEGDETRCGTLADLVLRSLSHLGVYWFPYSPRPDELNTLLAGIVGSLLTRHVWRYQDGASGQNGQYLIHPLFADACFRLPASKVFNRTGRLLWQAVRMSAEDMRSERISALPGMKRPGDDE